jgi:spoIIIJ-associated protein
MDWVETTGRTVEEAKSSALEQLGVDESDAEFEVVAEPKIGLFGRLKEEARVRARIQPRYPRSKGERRDRRRGRTNKEQAQAPSSSATPASAVTEEADDAGTTPARRRSRTDDNQSRASSQPAARRRRKTGGTGATMDKDEQQASFSDVKTIPTEELASSAEAFLRGLLKELGATATVTSSQAEDVIEVLVTGDDLGTLIGPKGATLLALQELTRIILQRHVPPSECRVTVDINGYRKRRQEALARFAQEVAAEVVASNKKRALEPMAPADRKVVHDAVNDIGGVTTVSEGEEPYRRVVLVPTPDAETAGADLEGVTS